MDKVYDVVVIGAGSIGVPAALNLALKGLKVLVLEASSAPGQFNNKKAIGGVRATHSDFGKISVCLRSIEIMSSWKETWGDDIGWMSNGYSYPAYTAQDEKTLKDLMQVQLGSASGSISSGFPRMNTTPWCRASTRMACWDQPTRLKMAVVRLCYWDPHSTITLFPKGWNSGSGKK